MKNNKKQRVIVEPSEYIVTDNFELIGAEQFTSMAYQTFEIFQTHLTQIQNDQRLEIARIARQT